ncbi:hypothetical protein [Aestuariimicrobium ganziense]|uniref:hypothetical protein n=1 Tax=Aestuariimicrobium ganziense TaxID=2773677 RepID=UPI0019430442|nr:hypothetical protein [Aestuariimicrobium ganziense]
MRPLVVRVAAFMGVFTAFYYAVASATDAVRRDGVDDATETGIREACAVRLVLVSESLSGTEQAA